MKNAIIIHGKPEKEEFFDPATPSPSNAQWLPWLQKQLGLKGVTAQTPEMPDAWEPNYEKWKSVFELFPLNEETILVGHSCGGGFLARWLSEHDARVGQVLLVAPWIDPARELGPENNFFDFNIDQNLTDKTVNGITIFYSTDDDKVITESVERLKIIKNLVLKEFHDKGHFVLDDMGTREFPELLEEIK